jgi:hypothetical protein
MDADKDNFALLSYLTNIYIYIYIYISAVGNNYIYFLIAVNGQGGKLI